ncbi:unnamed protein product [Arctia plantaginis]|uniref:Uncharacterized protein n=1 Tax=Arctia plantaginis TaxID=874455 RepID=A0A8S1AXI3_ARCPL|nr:unnamed protein product [Arctia plantaginis]
MQAPENQVEFHISAATYAARVAQIIWEQPLMQSRAPLIEQGNNQVSARHHGLSSQAHLWMWGPNHQGLPSIPARTGSSQTLKVFAASSPGPAFSKTVILPTVSFLVSGSGGATVKARAFLDSGARGCIITIELYSQTEEQGKNKSKCFSKNDTVLYKRFITKAKYTWCKGTILASLGRVVYLVKDLNTLENCKRHINQLVPYKGYNDHPQSYPQYRTQSPAVNQHIPSPSPLQTTIRSSPGASRVPILLSSSPNVGGRNLPRRTVELDEPNTSTMTSPSREEEDIEDPLTTAGEQQACLRNSAGVTGEREDNSEDEPTELETVPVAPSETPIQSSPSSPIQVPRRSLRKRPKVCYKKYF